MFQAPIQSISETGDASEILHFAGFVKHKGRQVRGRVMQEDRPVAFGPTPGTAKTGPMLEEIDWALVFCDPGLLRIGPPLALIDQ